MHAQQTCFKPRYTFQTSNTDTKVIFQCSVIASCLPTMRPLLTHAKARTSHTKSTSTKSSKDNKSASSGSKGGPLSPIWGPPPPSSPRKAPYQSLDEYDLDLEDGESSFEMTGSPQARQKARFGSHAKSDFGPIRPLQSILTSERLGQEKPTVSLPEPRYIGPSRL